jgi:hypothetical protein
VLEERRLLEELLEELEEFEELLLDFRFFCVLRRLGASDARTAFAAAV